MSKTLIIKNNTVVDLCYIGIPILVSGQVSITDETLIEELAYDVMFTNAISTSIVIINNGTIDLGIYDAINFIRSRFSPCLEITLSDGNNPYINVTETNFAVKTKFLFPGSSRLGTPSFIMVNVMTNGGLDGSYGVIRIYDVTHLQIIAEKNIGILVFPPSPISLGALSNIPSGDSIFEIQGKLVGTSITYMKIYCLGFRW